MKTNLRSWILFSLFTVLVMPPVVAATGVPELVKDISTATDDSSPTEFVYSSGWFYFAADDGVNGRELWRTDGSTGNTGMVMDIYPGQWSSEPHFLFSLGGTVLFWAKGPDYGLELWTTDGTTTTRITDTPSPPSGGTNPLAAGISGGVLYFALTNAGTIELWKSGGTSGTTEKIEDIASGTRAGIGQFVDANGTLYFRASDGVGEWNHELWTSNGTAGGTGMVTEFNPSGSGVSQLFAFGDNVLFQGDDGDGYGYELCISDGTPGGTE
ncbi:MAG: hypothetical protein GY851_23170, partial [bacterium]|nr:hypothetical protein [bacterium]